MVKIVEGTPAERRFSIEGLTAEEFGALTASLGVQSVAYSLYSNLVDFAKANDIKYRSEEFPNIKLVDPVD